MKTAVFNAIEVLSSRSCAMQNSHSADRACHTGAASAKRRFCMLCIHCPKCINNPGAVTCDLCAACRACGAGDGCRELE